MGIIQGNIGCEASPMKISLPRCQVGRGARKRSFQSLTSFAFVNRARSAGWKSSSSSRKVSFGTGTFQPMVLVLDGLG